MNLKEALKKQALDEYIKGFCPDVSEPPVPVKIPEKVCLRCKWQGHPTKTHTDRRGYQRYKCPNCHGTFFMEKRND